jgi:hypothetical protein
VQPLDDVPGEALVNAVEAPNLEQLRAIEEPGVVFVSAGAAKTASNVNHVGLYVGNGWMIHSSSYNAGVLIDWVGSGYYRDNFVFGRHLTTSGSSGAASHADTVTNLNGGDAV